MLVNIWSADEMSCRDSSKVELLVSDWQVDMSPSEDEDMLLDWSLEFIEAVEAAAAQVWSLIQFYSVDFSQSRIGVNSEFSTNAQSIQVLGQLLLTVPGDLRV